MSLGFCSDSVSNHKGEWVIEHDQTPRMTSANGYETSVKLQQATISAVDMSLIQPLICLPTRASEEREETLDLSVSFSS